MYEYEQQHETTSELYEHLNEMLSVAELIGIKTANDICFGLSEDMEHEQMVDIETELAAAIELARQQALGAMNRCPCNFKWRREGAGYRCEGGSHYVADSELDKYRKDNS